MTLTMTRNHPRNRVSGDAPAQHVVLSHPSESQFVFPDSSLTVFESHVLLFHYYTKHQLSSKALDDLIQLLKLHMPKEANIPSSSYTLKKFFKDLFPDLASSVHFYCSNCHQLLTTESEVCNNIECGSDTEYFISVPLHQQIKRRLGGMYPVLYSM